MSGSLDPTVERQRRIFALLRAALDIEKAERSDWLRQQCPDDEALQAEVLKLLDTAPSPLLDSDAANLAGRMAAIDGAELPITPGSKMGEWVIERTLGQGGMGAVYLAHRQGDGFVQRGALKLIKRGMDSAAVLARFRRERQILSRLEHPHIAHLLDGGVSQDGQPWFVMEYIEGRNLRMWLQEEPVNLATRLAIVLELGYALTHAHQHLVVHCDLKPENILIDTQGNARLLDFGIAKLLADDDQAEQTATQHRFVSRAYAAPEQLRGDAATTAVDVYQLGALLFELLTGTRLDPSQPVGSVSNWLVRAQQDGNASTRHPVPAAILAGDASIIVARATEAEPSRRYASVQALCADIRAWQAGLPIAARPDSAMYRIRRFIGRHRLTSATAAIALVSILIGAALAWWQAGVAEREARLARSAQSFLINVFEAAAPDVAAGKEITARELLDRGSERIAVELADQPQLRAEMQLTLGTLQAQLGQYTHAANLLDAARAALIQHSPAAATQATLELATVERELDHTDKAEQLLASIPDNATHATRSRQLIERAQLREKQGRFDEALADARAALAIDQDRGTPARADQARDLQIQALLLARQAHFDEAAKVFEHAISEARAVHGQADTRVALMLNDYGGALAMQGRSSEAETALNQALEIRRTRLGNDHPAVAETLQVLGVPLRSQGRFDEARSKLDEAIAIQRKVFGDQHSVLANTLNSRGMVEFSQRRPDAAEPFLQEAVAIYRNLGQFDTPPAAAAANVLATVLIMLNRPDEAEPLMDHALAVHLKTVGAQHPLVMADLNSLAQLQYRRGNLAQAQAYASRAIAIVDAGNAPPREGAYVRISYANLLARAGRSDDALRQIDQAIKALTAIDANEARLPAAHAVRADALLGLGRLDEAEVLAQRVLPLRAPDDRRSLAMDHILLARIAAARHDVALERRERALAHAMVEKMSAPEPLLLRELERP